MLECMLAHSLDPKKLKYPVWVSPKLDGVRARYFNGKFYSRDNKQWNDLVTTHLFPYDECKPQYEVPLDGEFYRHGWQLQRINGAIAVKRLLPNDDTKEIHYYIFDVVNPSQNYASRFVDRIESLVYSGFKIVQPEICTNFEDIKRMHYEYTCLQGYEGTMVRNCDFGYQEGRSWRLLKLKDFFDDEFTVVGKVVGLGKHQGRLGSLTCITKEGRLFEVGGGYTDAQREHYWRMDVKGMTIKVSFQNYTENGIPRHPNFIMELI